MAVPWGLKLAAQECAWMRICAHAAVLDALAADGATQCVVSIVCAEPGIVALRLRGCMVSLRRTVALWPNGSLVNSV